MAIEIKRSPKLKGKEAELFLKRIEKSRTSVSIEKLREIKKSTESILNKFRNPKSFSLKKIAHYKSFQMKIFAD